MAEHHAILEPAGRAWGGLPPARHLNKDHRAGAGRLPPGYINCRAPRDGMARAEDLPIQRSRSEAECGVIGLVIGLTGGLGVSMIRRS